MASRNSSDPMVFDVIVPVFRGLEQTKSCINSVLVSPVRTPFQLIVVDDCSPEPTISAWLDELAGSHASIHLMRNERNLGFVGSVNRAMSIHPERDVVLLNSDTEVAGDWLDRIAAAAQRHPDAATLTPFSNCATICSYPYPGWSGGLPGTLGLSGLDRIFSLTLGGVVMDLPTGVGFCMYLRRAALSQLGMFDEELFGRGYGEENDFCRRAAKEGWRNLLCADVFVFHCGSVSFGSDRFGLMEQGARNLLARHPEYDQVVRQFAEADPLGPLRAAVDRARSGVSAAEADAVCQERADSTYRPQKRSPYERLRRTKVSDSHNQGVLLHVSHSWGGGTDRWITDFAAADRSFWNLVLRSRTSRNHAAVRLELIDPVDDGNIILAWDLAEPIKTCAIAHDEYRDILALLIEGLQPSAIIVSSLIGHSLEVLDCSPPTCLILHDLFPFCPALFGSFGKECVRCEVDDLTRCLESNSLNVFWNSGPAQQWVALRRAYSERLRRGRLRLAAPSRSVVKHYAALFPAIAERPVEIIPHAQDFAPCPNGPRPDVPSKSELGRLRVLVPGRLLPHKGLRLLEEILPHVADFADVLLIGCGDFGLPFEHMPHVELVRDYDHNQLAGVVAAFAPDCALLLSLLPETFSYTLSEMHALAIPVVATRLGAFRERIEHGRTGFLVDPDRNEIEALMRHFARDKRPLFSVAEVLRGRAVRLAETMVCAYVALLELGGERPQVRDVRPGLIDLLIRANAGAHSEAALSKEESLRMTNQIVSLQTEMSLVQQSIRALQAECESYRARLNDVVAHRDALLASSSWKLTEPLRTLAAALRRRDAEPVITSQVETKRSDPVCYFRRGSVFAAWWARRIGEYANCAVESLEDVYMDTVFGAQTVLASNERVRLTDIDLPLSSVWDSQLTIFSRPEGASGRDIVRREVLEGLGVADECRLVVGMGGIDVRYGFRVFAETAMRMGDMRNGFVFVWVCAAEELSSLKREEVYSLPRSLRRLFVVDDHKVERWLLAGDVYLGCADPVVCDRGIIEALAMGVSVLVKTNVIAPKLLETEMQSGAIVSGKDLCAKLMSFGERRTEIDYSTADRIREKLGGPSSIEVFLGQFKAARLAAE